MFRKRTFRLFQYPGYVSVMHLSLSIPTYPRLGNGWGFVAICQHICPQGWDICPRIFTVFGIPIQNVGDLQHEIVPRWGIYQTTLANPHPCPTWGRWGMTMIGALQLAIDYNDDGIPFDIYDPNRLGNSFPLGGSLSSGASSYG